MMEKENDDENSMEFWRTKCMKLEKVIKTLSNHCVRVVEHHEDLLVKFKKNQDQYEQLKAKCKERGQQIKQAREVLIPVSNELKLLREKYEVAVRCQIEAESFAIETTNKNKKLHRQSVALSAKLGSFDVVDINIDDDPDEDVNQGNEEEKKYIERMGSTIEELEEEKSTLSIQLKETNENFYEEKESNARLRERIEVMREELQQAKTCIKEQEALLQKVAVTSEMAYKEYQDMEQTFKKETLVRNEAERFAKRLCTERDQARRESAMALSKVADNKKLMDAMLEIQQLNEESAQMKDDFLKKITALEGQLAAAKEVYNAETLDAENQELNDEKDALQKKLEKSEADVTELRTKYTDLQKTYESLEKKYKEFTYIPPPPPLPPTFSTSKVGGFLSKIVGRKGQRERAKEQLKKGGVATNETHSKAVEEMMSRIKSGNIGLKPTLQRRTQSLPEKDEPSAMNELQGLLNKMKKARSEDDLSVFGETGVSDDTELGRILRKRQQKIQDAPRLSPPAPESDNSPAPRPVPAPRKLSTIQDEPDE